MHSVVALVALFCLWGLKEANSQTFLFPFFEGTRESSVKPKSSTKLVRTNRHPSYDRRSQIARLRREGVLKSYDQSKKISQATGQPREKVLRDLISKGDTKFVTSIARKPRRTQSEIGVALEDLPGFKKNVQRSFQDNSRRGARIWRGAKISEPDAYASTVVLVGNSGICTGSLISPSHILTAAHCYCEGVNQEATIGLSLLHFRKRAEVDVKNSLTMIPCHKLKSDADFEKNIRTGDLALYVLKNPIRDVPIKKIGSERMLRKAATVRAVGFGKTQNSLFGTKFHVDLPIASYDCTEIPQGPYACAARSEMIAGGMNKDTCEGDSGGPIYASLSRHQLFQVGTTSRGRTNDDSCGNGGIYVKLTTPDVRRWLLQNGVPRSAFAE